MNFGATTVKLAGSRSPFSFQPEQEKDTTLKK